MNGEADKAVAARTYVKGGIAVKRRARKPAIALLGAIAAIPILLSGWSYSVHGPSSSSDDVLLAPFLIALGMVGFLIVSRQPRNPVGWTFLVAYVAIVVDAILGTLLQLYLDRFSERVLVSPTILGFTDAYYNGVVDVTVWMSMLFFPVMYFPNGELPSLRWRHVVRVVLALLLLNLVAGIFDPGLASELFPDFQNPLATSLAANVTDIAVVGLIFTYLFAPLSLVLRFRRARGVERQQFKWPLLSALCGFTAIGLFLTAQILHGGWEPEWSSELALDPLTRTVAAVALTFEATAVISFPITVGFAILRYRLYDIDVIIRKTLVYSLLTGLLAVFYLGSVVLLQAILGRTAGAQSPLVIVLSTLLIAALFSPLRRRVQETIDRRFYRRKYDARRVLVEFARTARDEVELDELTAELVRVVEETMRPAAASLWLAAEKPDRRLSTSLVEPK